jgi:hypothetical protein
MDIEMLASRRARDQDRVPMQLSERDRAILDFERTWWTTPGSKESLIRERLGLSPTRYYRLLASLADEDAAIAYDPLTVKRLRRRRAARQAARVSGRRAGPR